MKNQKSIYFRIGEIIGKMMSVDEQLGSNLTLFSQAQARCLLVFTECHKKLLIDGKLGGVEDWLTVKFSSINVNDIPNGPMSNDDFGRFMLGWNRGKSGSNINLILRDYNLTQQQLADAIGVSLRTVNTWCNSDNKLSDIKIAKIENQLDNAPDIE